MLHAAAEVVLVVLAADHGHGAVLAQTATLLKKSNSRKGNLLFAV